MARKQIKYVCTKASSKEVKRKHTATHNGIVNDEGHWNGKLTFNLAWCIQMSRPICRNLWEHLQAKSFDAGEQETPLQTIYKQRQSLLLGSIKPNKTNNTLDSHGRINRVFLARRKKKRCITYPFWFLLVFVTLNGIIQECSAQFGDCFITGTVPRTDVCSLLGLFLELTHKFLPAVI